MSNKTTKEVLHDLIQWAATQRKEAAEMGRSTRPPYTDIYSGEAKAYSMMVEKLLSLSYAETKETA